MPSLRKVVEDVEYNTLPSPTTRGFSSATAARANKKLTTATSDGGGASGANTSHESRGDAESKTGKEAGVGNKKQSMKTNGGSKKEVIEIQSDEEDVTLSDLAKIKESSPSKTVVCSGRPLGKSTMQVRGATNNSAHVQNGATAKTGTFQGTVGKKDHPVSESSGKTGGVNNRSNASETSTKSITNQTSKASSSKSSAIQPSTTRPPVKFTAKNDNLSIAAPQTHHPYSANPTVLRNTNAIIQNIHMNLQNTMPMTQPPVIPGMEKWSEYRIDSAATVGELEAIRRRLLTLTNRVDLRIKEMNFLKAIGMTEWKGDNKRETTSEVIRKIIESGVSNGSKSGDNTLKRKRSQDSIDEKVESSNPEECSVCCPFCLSTNTSIGTNCSICDEKSNICLLCRGYCVKCKRLTCEDCLLRCDSCSSDTYCSDCMPRSGKCQKCNSSKPNMNIPQTAGATSQRTVSTAYQARQTNIAGIEAPPNRPIATGNMTTQPQVIHTPPDYSIHRFVVGMEEKGTLGLLVGERMNGVIVQKVYKKGHAEMIGVKQNDEICFPFTGALALNSCKP